MTLLNAIASRRRAPCHGVELKWDGPVEHGLTLRLDTGVRAGREEAAWSVRT